ncbi:MAG: HYR domain-containing protein [Bacteroidetes bacterium]|nr:HYR domain-containing protein [Bacteroidota bacterium]
MTRKVNGANQTLVSTLNPGGGNQVISRIRVFNSNVGAGTPKNVYVNNLQACLAVPGCPSNITLNVAPGSCNAVASYTAPTSIDNCTASPVVVQTGGLASGASFPVGVTTNTFRATDLAGNTATCSFTVTVVDNQAPAITCPANISVNATSGQCTAVVTYTAPVGTDNCPGATTTQTAGFAGGATFPSGTTTNTFTVTDASGNTTTCSFTVTVVDNQAPVITCPANISVNATSGQCNAVVTYTAPVGTDNCPGATTTQTAGLASGATFPVGVTTNTFRVTDASGTTTTCSFTVTVVDNQAPAITCPANISVNATSGQCNAVVTYTAPVGTDNCPGATTTQTAGLASGATFPVGVTTNTFRVTDASGTSTTCSFTVMVVDNQAPAITCPANISVNATSGQCTAVVTYTAPVGTDNCPGATTTQTAGLASGATFPSGITTNTFTVTDASGNTTTCSFTVTVVDNQAPAITCPANISVNATSGQCNAVVTYTAPVGTDNCPGATTTQTAGLASGATFPVIVTTNTFRVTDASGTTSTCSFTVTVVDNQAPAITCPANISVNTTSGQCTALVTYTAPVGTDNCPGATTTQTAGLASGATFPVGVTTNTFTVTDASGNTTTCSFTVTVVDNQAPAIICPANITVNNDPGLCSAVVTYSTPSGTDNCSGQTTALTAGLASGATFPIGTTLNTFTVTDAACNTSSCSFTVTVNGAEINVTGNSISVWMEI